MKASLSWLKTYVPIGMDIRPLSDALTMAGLEVDEVFDRFDYLEAVCVGHVLEVAAHPNADKLVVCRVDVGDQVADIVCGAPNVTAGIQVPVALPGTNLPNGITIEKSTIRGVASGGMICSAVELGLGDDHSGIMILKSDAPTGESLKQVLGLADMVLDIDLTPNRPDCLSIIGVAREIAALQQTPLSLPDTDMTDHDDRISSQSSVTIQAPELCPRYTARLVEDVTVGPSPFWLQDRLISVGLRPINNIVDITNFVMLEMGQPLHAFDLDRLAEQRIVVRTAAENETFVTLDGKPRQLSSDMLMICDGQKPVAVGGVMGGLNSEIEPTTRRVLIEGAYFNPVSIRKTAKRLGLNTDASHRFERGVDPEGTVPAVNRAAALIAEITGGEIVGGTIDENPLPYQSTTIRLDVAATNQHLGTRIDRHTMGTLLESIDFSVAPHDKNALVVTPPSFRVDVHRPEDLMEEVARLFGYNNIPTTFPLIPSEDRRPSVAWEFRCRLKRLMHGFGFTEAISYSFISDTFPVRLRLSSQDPRQRQLAILNPLTEDQSVMRTSLIPGLLTAMWNNINHQMRHLKLFEIGRVFISNGPRELPDEPEFIAGLWTGSRHGEHWGRQPAACDFYDIKGTVEQLLATLGVDDVTFSRATVEKTPYFKSGHGADINARGNFIGTVGEIHPKIMADMDLQQPAFVFELDMDGLTKQLGSDQRVRPIPKFPATTRDVTVIVDKSVEAAAMLAAVSAVDQPLLESLHLFDVFEGDPIPAGKKSVSFRITYRSHTETLEDQAVNVIHKALTAILLDHFKAALPG